MNKSKKKKKKKKKDRRPSTKPRPKPNALKKKKERQTKPKKIVVDVLRYSQLTAGVTPSIVASTACQTYWDGTC